MIRAYALFTPLDEVRNVASGCYDRVSTYVRHTEPY
jgi:hypothetical protein